MKTRRVLYFTAPKQVEIREEELLSLGDDEVLVETLCSAISAGTEMLAYRGEFPQLTDTSDTISSDLKYPMKYGYACAGKVKEIGKLVNNDWKDRLVFAFHPHASSFTIHPSSLFIIPDFITPESACFLPNMETAVNLVQDAAPILGEKVLVLGQGIVGLLTSALLNEFPLEELVTADFYEMRRKQSEKIGVTASINPQTLYTAYTQKFDVTFELSGSPSALNTAIDMTMFSGRIIIGSWYGNKRADIHLGEAFHRSRIQLLASQVSTISPEISARWDKPRRFETAWKALARIKPERWITHRFKIQDAAQAYQLLNEHPAETMQVVFEYSNVI